MELSSIEIAQQTKLSSLREISDRLDLLDDEIDFRGRHTAKIRLEVLDRLADRPDGKLILVTAMTPTKFGEGKTLTTVGMGQALQRIDKKGMIAIREPSLGPVFGVKGGGTGGGYSQVAPMEQINLHFTGDIHAVTTAHNLLAAMLDSQIFKGNPLDIDVRDILLPRCIDMNERALREIVMGLGGRTSGVPRESGFVLTSASEVMAILALTSSRSDLKQRLGEMVVGYDRKSNPIHAKDLEAHRAMAVVLNDAIMPNLVQTLEQTPALIHAGPFANIAHGTNSVLADRIALKLADYVVTEAGFGADLGAEKFFNLVCRSSGLWPSAVVIVATCRAIKYHGGALLKTLTEENMSAFEKGLGNLEIHVKNVQSFGVPVVVAINRFPFDTEAEVAAIEERCRQLGVDCASHEAFVRGGEGATELASRAVSLADSSSASPQFTYEAEDTAEDKVRKVAKSIYRASEVRFETIARKKLAKFREMGYGDLPVCMAKTQNSISDDPTVRGVPGDFMLRVTDVRLSAGAGFLVMICGNMMLMPGLPKVPSAVRMDVDDSGRITGLS